ncbi:MAG TPA: hypothetical protein VK808_00335 [Bacteroidia bacterium]|nr:hypothetical protein [Bacteroidia bacterium]
MLNIKPRKLIFSLFIAAVAFALIDMRLAHAHINSSFKLFRKDNQSSMVFTFGILFWGFLLAFPFSMLPFSGLSFRKRYFLWVASLMLAMELAYLFAFFFRFLFH